MGGDQEAETATAAAAAERSPNGTMRAAVLTDVRRIEIRSIAVPRLKPNEVLVRVQAVGLCGTDLHIYEGHSNYNRDARNRLIPLREQPQVLGHEVAGVVTGVGDEVTDLRPGERVVIDQGRTCVGSGREDLCEYCLTGDSHQCEQYAEHGLTGLQGGFAEYIAVPAVNAVRVKTGLEAEKAAMAEPLGCIVHSMHRIIETPARYTFAGDGSGPAVSTVLVAGAGPAGLLFVQFLRRVVGFQGTLLTTEPNPRKRALAKEFGAEIIDPRQEDVAEAVMERTGGRGIEMLIEATGASSVFVRIPEILRKQGTLVLYGQGHSGVDLSVLSQIQFLEPTIIVPIGASGGYEKDGRPSVYLEALRLIEAGTIDVEPIISHRYSSLDAVPSAFGGDYAEADFVKGVVVL